MATTLRTWSGLISALLAGSDLTEADTGWAMDQLVLGDASPAQISGFLIALRAKGETAAEIAGLAKVLRSHATPVRIAGPFVDIVGTGGDRTGVVNVSTMAAVVAASTGVTVVKHGGGPRPRRRVARPIWSSIWAFRSTCPRSTLLGWRQRPD